MATTEPEKPAKPGGGVAALHPDGGRRASAPVVLRPVPATTRKAAGPGSAAPSIAAERPMTTPAIDRMMHAWLGRLTLGLSPASLTEAYMDWASHLAMSPGKQAQLVEKAARKWLRFISYAGQCAQGIHPPGGCIVPLPQDRRFAAAEWHRPPFNLMHQAFLLTQQWWHNATTDVRGVSRHHEEVVSFAARQLLDIWSPSNFILTNPEVLQVTMEQGGANLQRGWNNLLEDNERATLGRPPVGAENFRPGETVAVTPGKVVYRNRLIELIQYAPATPKVHAEPVLILPAWIMKYYILDLSPENSLIRFLVDSGHTVFVVSWKNPGPEERDLGMEDYLRLGVRDSLQAINAIVPERQVHAVGYCLGGTLLAIAAAAFARDRDERLKSVTLLAAQIDFSEAGELMLFIDESQVAFLEDNMWEQGYLDTKQMAGAFQLLRSNDLIWSRMVRDYMRGDRQPMNDLMAWNADATRMPYRMHSEYLRHLFLDNDLAEGRFRVEERPVALTDLRVPIFAVGTVWDHVAPWRSVYKVNLLSDTEVTFLLTSGGHNAGIVSEPGHAGRNYRVARRREGDRFIDADQWAQATPLQEGSWWPEWQRWLAAESAGMVAPPSLGAAAAGYPPLAEAPGSYVLEE